MKRKISLLLVLILLMAGIGGCSYRPAKGARVDNGMELITEKTEYVRAQKHEPLPNYKISFDFLSDDEMPLGVFNGPSYYGATPESNAESYVDGAVTRPSGYHDGFYFSALRNAGINFIATFDMPYDSRPDDVIRSMDMAYQHGIGTFILDGGYLMEHPTPEAISERISEYIDHPGLMGFYVTDEPSADKILQLKPLYDAYNSLEDPRTKKLYLHTNMLPGYGSSEAFGGRSWEEFIRYFLETTGSKFLIYDHYVFSGLDSGTGTRGRGSYFNDLLSARKVCNEFGVPFWVYVQAGGQWDRPMDTTKIFPSEGEFLWNINTSIAYGAKGIKFYQGVQWASDSQEVDGGINSERLGLFGVQGNVNRWYYYAQKAFKQVKAADEILMNSASAGVITIGEIARNNNANNKYYFDANFQEGHWRELKSVEGTEAIIGCFDYNGTSAFWVVNNSDKDKDTVKLHFNKRYGYDIIQRGLTFPVAAETVTLTLEPGEAALVTLRT